MDASESGPERVSVMLQGSQAVTDGSTAARAFAVEQFLSDDETARLCIVVEEWLTNLYEHGGVGTSDTVELSLESETDGIRMTVVDPGMHFDPRDVRLDVETPDRGGGAGLEIMKAWATWESYDVVDGKNRLVLLLPIDWR